MQHNPLNTAYDRATLTAVRNALRNYYILGLGSGRCAPNTMREEILTTMGPGWGSKKYENVLAFVAEFLPDGGLDTPFTEMDCADLRERLIACGSEAGRQIREIDQENQRLRMKRTFAHFA